MPQADSHLPGRLWQRVDGVDILRGLSILFVLMNHVNMRLRGAHIPFTHGLPHQLVATLIWNGQAAVQMFFVISGYLITSTSIRRWGTPAALQIRSFYWLRIARILPLFVLILAILSGLSLAGVPDFLVEAKTGGLGRALLAALTFHIGYLEATRGYLPGNWDVLWSLGVEEAFYLVFPLAAVLLRRRTLLMVLLGAFIVAGPFARIPAFNPNEVWQEYSYLGGMDGIAFGCLAAMLLAGRRLSLRAMVLSATAGIAILIFSFCFTLTQAAFALGRTGLNYTLLAVGVCLIIAAASQSAWKAPRFLAPLLVLGQRSYEVYLCHMFVVYACFALFLHLGKSLSLVIPLFLAVFLLAGLLGWAVAVFFAEPVNVWIRRRTGHSLVAEGAAIPLVD